MAISCEPVDLTTAAKCFSCLRSDERDMVMTYLLAVIAGGSTDPDVLSASAKCFQCFPKNQLRQIQAYLLCQILNSGGGDPADCPQDMQIDWNDASVNLGEKMGFTAAANMAGITSLTFRQASLQTAINLALQADLLSVEFTNLTAITASTAFISCSNLASFTAPLLASVSGSGQLVVNGAALTSLVLPSLVTAKVIQFLNCSSLATVTMASLFPDSGNSITFTNGGLNQASVDHILARCASNPAFATGNVGLAGGTNATPSAAGLVNKGILAGRGVSVTTN